MTNVSYHASANEQHFADPVGHVRADSFWADKPFKHLMGCFPPEKNAEESTGEDGDSAEAKATDDVESDDGEEAEDDTDAEDVESHGEEQVQDAGDTDDAVSAGEKEVADRDEGSV